LLEELKPYIDADDKLKVFEYVDRADYPARLNMDWFRALMGEKPKTGLSSLLSMADAYKDKQRK
jgi:hypothetical protein